MNSLDNAKIWIFILTLFISAFLLIGIIPLIIFIMGIYRFYKKGNISSVETSAIAIMIYISAIGGFIFLIAYFEDQYMLITIFLVSFGLIFFTNNFYLTPIKKNVNHIKDSRIIIIIGIIDSFLSNLKIKFNKSSTLEDIEKLSNLKDSGHISQSEYEEAKEKLLRRL